MNESIEIRPILASDNAAMADVIRSVMTSFSCVGDGYSINDAEVDNMYEAYTADRAIYYIVSINNEVMGGAGIAPLAGGDYDTCELKKMYFLPQLRMRGQGQKLMTTLINDATELGYKKMYLETTVRMEAANKLYTKNGFTPLEKPMGNTGHGGCDAYYMLEV